MYKVFRSRDKTVDLRQSRLFPQGFLYNNGQYPGAKAGSGRAVAGQNERKGGFGIGSPAEKAFFR